MPLPLDEILERIPEEAEGWDFHEGTIRREFAFSTFLQSLAFVKKLAEIAEAQKHHPEILIQKNRVVLTLCTQEESGVGDKDFRLAGSANTAYELAYKD